MKEPLASAVRIAVAVLLAAVVLGSRQQARRMQESSAQLREKSYAIRTQVMEANTTHSNFEGLAIDLLALAQTNEVARGLVSFFGMSYR